MNEKPQVPSVSIVLPVRNEGKFIGNCLESLMRQDYPNIVEILVFDGMSTDATRDVVVRFQTLDPRIGIFDNPRNIQTIALNRAIGRARGDIVARIDAHAVYQSDYVTQCVDHLMKGGMGSVGGVVNVGGPQVPASHASWQARAIVFAHNSRFGIGVARHRQGSYEGYVETVWPGAFWKYIFDEIGPFREEFTRTEDIDWNQRLRQKGYRILLTQKIRAMYFPRDSLLGLWKQNFANGRGVSQTLLVNPMALSLRHVIPCLFLLAIIGSILAAFFSSLALFALGGILASYMALCVLFSIQVGLKHGVKYFFMMPLVFWTIHFSYGLGSLWGLLKYGVIERMRR